MTKADINIAQIVTQSSFLSERQSDHCTIDANSDRSAIGQRLERWCQVVAQGNWQKLERRWQWDGLDMATVQALLATSSSDCQDLPPWAATLSAVIRTAAQFEPKAILNLPLDANKPLPFEDLLLPVILVARQKLSQQLGITAAKCSCLELLTESAYLSLERNLLQRLVNLCTPTLNNEFSYFRPLGHSLLTLLLQDTQTVANSVHYNAFVQKLLSDGLLTFFQKYPVLGRLVVTTVDYWVEAIAEFIQHLQADLPEIEQVFDASAQTPTGKIAQINSALADSHHRGRSVIALTFDSGLKLIYKPRNLGLEVAYSQLLDWCNQYNLRLRFKVPRILNRPTHGWVEYIEQLPCADEFAAQRFYQRAGMTLCLLYVLKATDCHYENFIASGEHLLLVDMEALLHPEASPLEGFLAAQTTVEDKFWHSVLRTGLLPRWQIDKDSQIAFDVSGLGSVEAQQAPGKFPRWKAVNTDDMHLAYEQLTMPVRANVATLRGVPLSPNDYLKEIVTGFEQMYRCLLQHREALFKSDSPLAAMRSQQVRFIFRNTNLYHVILQKSLAPEYLQNGSDRSIELDILSRALIGSQQKPAAWAILSQEIAAMEQLDIPRFEASADGTALMVGSKIIIPNYFKQSSYSQVVEQLQALNEVDLSEQVALIQGAFYARVVRTPNRAQSRVKEKVDFAQISPLSSAELICQAQFIAQELEKSAIPGANSSISWIGLNYLPNVERFQLQPLSDNLYDGNCGVALFLAALERVTGNAQFRSLTLGALQPLRQLLQTADGAACQKYAKQVKIGGAVGLGSIIYALVRVSQLIQEATLLADARQVADLISPQLIASDRSLDIIGGAAGAILGLLTLYQETNAPEVLQLAVSCGQHLLAHQISVAGLPKAWITLAPQPLTGFSHGAAGIAYALLRLYQVTGDRCYLDAAVEGIAYEHSAFVPAAGNWLDFRGTNASKEPNFMLDWCHGAVGIGLARLGGLSILESDRIYEDIEIALHATLDCAPQAVDHLCCGNFGRVELLLVAAEKLSRPELLTNARQRATWLVKRAAQANNYQIFLNAPQLSHPSFFQGVAGIGYELLRLAKPSLPSVLLWE